MSISPSSIDTLLADMNLADRMIAQQSSGLRGMVKFVQQAEDKLNRLDFKLETPLLGDGGLDKLIEGQILGALSRATEQQTAQGQASEEVYNDNIQHKRTLDHSPNTRQPQPDRPTSRPGTTEPCRKNRADKYTNRKMSDALQADTGDIKNQQIQTHLKGKKVKLYTVPEPEKKQNIQQQSNGKGRVKSYAGRAVVPQIDAMQARDRMALRVTKAGVATAWYSPVNLSLQQQQAKQPGEKDWQKADVSAVSYSDATSHDPVCVYSQKKDKLKIKLSDTDIIASNTDGQKPVHTPVAEQQTPVNLSLQQQQAKQPGEKDWQKADVSAVSYSGATSHDPACIYSQKKDKLKIKLSDTDVIASNTDGQKPVHIPVAEQQIERSLKKLMPQKYTDFNATREKRQKKSSAVPASDHPQKSAAGLSSEQTVRENQRGKVTSQRQHGLSHESTPRAPGTPGGLRGLAAKATGPLEQDSNSTGAGDISTQQNKLLPTRENIEVNTIAGGKSGNALAELAELLADEARRAGIDLEQFRP